MKGVKRLGVTATLLFSGIVGLAGCDSEDPKSLPQEQKVDVSGDLDETSEKLEDWDPSADLGLKGSQGSEDKED